VVVGGGIVGCGIALALADRGAPVLMVGRDPAGSASAQSFGSISALGQQQMGYFGLACAGMAAWPGWAARLGGGERLGFARAGSVQWASTPLQGQLLTEQADRAMEAGYQVRLIGRAELAGLLPEARIGPLWAASHARADAQVGVAAVLAAARAALESAGVQVILEGGAELRADGRGALVMVGERRLRPATVVLAAGAESAEVAAGLGVDLPTVPSPGLLVRTSPVSPIATGVVRLPAGPGPEVHLRQLADGTVLLGEGWPEELARDPTMARARALVSQAARFFPALLHARVERMTLAWRAMPSDRVPIVGRVAGLPWLYVAIPRGGVTIAPALGELVADELLEGSVDELLVPLRPGRFADRATEVARDVGTVVERPPWR